MNRNAILKSMLLMHGILLSSNECIVSQHHCDPVAYVCTDEQVILEHDDSDNRTRFDRFVEWVITRGVLPVAVMYAGGHIGGLIADRACNALVPQDGNAVKAVIQGIVHGTLIPLVYGAIDVVTEPAYEGIAAGMLRGLVRGVAWRAGVESYCHNSGRPLLSAYSDEVMAGGALGLTLSFATYTMLQRVYNTLMAKRHALYEVEYEEYSAE